MKKSVKREKNKYPYNRMKHSLSAQIKAIERRKHGKMNRYAIIDSKGKVIEKFRLKFTALQMLSGIQKDYYVRLKVVELDEYGKVVTTKIK